MGTQYTLAVAIAIALSEGGLGLLRMPKRLLAYVSDLADPDSREVYVFAANCDEDFLAFYVRASRVGTGEALEQASQRAEVLMTDRRFIMPEVARDVSRALASGIARVLGVTLPPQFEVAAIPYGVFVCCREVVEPTGVRTSEGDLAMRVHTALSQAGLRVFYPRMSLVREPVERHDVLTRDALDTAKVLLVVCSNVLHLKSAWVQAQLTRFRALHGDEPERVVPCLWGIDPAQLPEELRSCSPYVVTGDVVPSELVERIADLSRKPIKSGSLVRTNSDGSSRKRVPSWMTTNDLRYRTENVRVAEGVARVVTVCPIKLGGKDITATYESGGAREKTVLRGLCVGDEALVVMDADGRLISLISRDGDEGLRSFVLTLSWEQVYVVDRVLVLRMRNPGRRSCALSDLMLRVEGEPRTLVQLGSHGILLAGEERTLKLTLDDWAYEVLRSAASYDLFVFGRKVPRR